MAVFAYKAVDRSSAAARRSGTIAADTPRQARDLLRQRGLDLRDLRQHRESQQRWRTPRGHRWQVTLLVRELATLLSVGVPLLEALDTASQQHTGAFGASILLLRDRVAGGSSLAEAMRQQPRLFDELVCTIAEVGEDSGTLDSSLDRLAEFREHSEQFRSRLGTILIYPAIVLLVAIASTLFLMSFVVPQILQPLIEQGKELPLPTRIIQTLSNGLLHWGWLLGIIVIGAVIALVMALRTDRGRLARDRLALRLPLLGPMFHKQAVVRLAVVLSTLLKSGVPFVRALQIGRRIASNMVLRDALVRLETAVTAGADIGEALRETGAFAPMVIQMFSLGQQTGRLEEMLDRLATAYDQQLAGGAQRLAAILEPALILLLALMVLFIVLATVLPILEAGNVVA